MFLSDAIGEVSDCLIRLGNESSLPAVHQNRDCALFALRRLLAHPEFADNHRASLADPDVSQIYRCLASPYPSNQWAALAMRDALLCGVLVTRTDRSEATTLVSALKIVQALPALPVDETLTAARIALVAIYLSHLPDQTKEQTHAALVLDRIAAILKESSRFPEHNAPHPENVAAVLAAAQPPTTPSETRELSPTVKLQKLTARLSTRLGAAAHYSHMPAIRWHPLAHEIKVIRQFLSNSKSPASVDIVVGHLLFGGFAPTLYQLGDAADQEVTMRPVPGGRVLAIRAPQIHDPGHALDTPGYESVTQILQLPLPRDLANQIERVREAINAAGGENPAKLMLAKTNQHLRAFGQGRGISLSLKRVSRLLPTYLEEGANDETVLHLLHLAPPNARDAGIYYFSPARRLLEDRFVSAVTRLATEVGCDALLESGWSSIEENPAIHFGQSIRPSVDTLRKLLDHLRGQFLLGRGRPPPQKLIRAFNAKAAYVTLLFLAATGARPTNEVFPASTSIDPSSARALLSEKDSLLYRSTRVAHLDQRIADALRELAILRQSMELNSVRNDDRSQQVFLLDTNGIAYAPTIPHMKKFVPGFAECWPWPNDALRHHFRSRLWELGCPSDCLALLMGHVGKSHTADNQLATLQLGDANRQAAPFVARLLDELGFDSR